MKIKRKRDTKESRNRKCNAEKKIDETVENIKENGKIQVE